MDTYHVVELEQNDESSWVGIQEAVLSIADSVQFTCSLPKRNPITGFEDFPQSKNFASNVIEELTTYRTLWLWKWPKCKYILCTLNDSTAELLRKVNRIADWAIFSDSEDWAFHKDGQTILWTVSHERLIFINEDYIDFFQKACDIKIIYTTDVVTYPLMT